MYLLRCIQLGLKLEDLDVLEQGTVMDMMCEAANDEYKYKPVATQDDFDRF